MRLRAACHRKDIAVAILVFDVARALERSPFVYGHPHRTLLVGNHRPKPPLWRRGYRIARSGQADRRRSDDRLLRHTPSSAMMSTLSAVLLLYLSWNFLSSLATKGKKVRLKSDRRAIRKRCPARGA